MIGLQQPTSKSVSVLNGLTDLYEMNSSFLDATHHNREVNLILLAIVVFPDHKRPELLYHRHTPLLQR